MLEPDGSFLQKKFVVSTLTVQDKETLIVIN